MWASVRPSVHCHQISAGGDQGRKEGRNGAASDWCKLSSSSSSSFRSSGGNLTENYYVRPRQPPPSRRLPLSSSSCLASCVVLVSCQSDVVLQRSLDTRLDSLSKFSMFSERASDVFRCSILRRNTAYSRLSSYFTSFPTLFPVSPTRHSHTNTASNVYAHTTYVHVHTHANQRVRSAI